MKDATKAPKKKAVPRKTAKYEFNHGAVVGWVIGGTLVLMMLSFLVIYIQKHKLKEQQITTKNWAGPSPFIENGQDGSQDGVRSSHRISLSSFLPQRMSRRLSLLPEADEELEDISPGTTFGDRHPEASSAQQGAGQEAEGRKGEEEEKKNSGQTDTPTSVNLEALALNGVGERAEG